MSRRSDRRFNRFVALHELPLLAGLMITWMALWGEISLMTLLSGLLIALLALRIFYLPPVKLGGRLNLWWTICYLAYFLWNIAVASVHVAWLAIRPGPSPKTAILKIPLLTESDFIVTLVGMTISLIPGSLVAEVDRLGSTLYLHVLDTPSEKEVTAMRNEVARIERLLIRALGSRADLRRVNEHSEEATR